MGTVKYTGPVASFHCPTNAEIRSLKVHFSPKQLGEGDPSPENVREIEGWDACKAYKCEKNIGKVKGYSATSLQTNNGTRQLTNNYGTTLNTVDYNLPDTSVVITQNQAPDTTTKSSYKNGYICVILDDLIFDETYNISFKITNIVNNPLNAVLSNLKGMSPYGSQITPQIINDNIVCFTVPFKAGTKGDNYKAFELRICGMSFTMSEFMVTTVNVDDRTFEPYRGETVDYEFGVLGKNKLNIGTVSFTSYKKYEIEGGLMPATYTASALITSDDEDSTKSLMLFQNENGTIKQIFLERNIRNAVTFILTQPATSVYIYSGDSYQRSVGDATTWSEVQLELGSTATTYEPYDPKHTVYGGWVDLISGEVQQEWTEPLTLGEPYYYGGNVCFKYIYPSKYTVYSSSMPVDRVFSTFMKSNFSINPGNNFIFGGNSAFVKTDGNGNLNPEWTEWYDSLETKPTISLKLYEPITYHLAPTQLQTFLGQNNVWSNADYVEVEYDLHETQDILARKQFIIANQPHIVRPAAAPLQNFTTDVLAPLKECKVHFSPVQDTSNGAPSPDNICQISGWTGLEVNQSGKNINNNWLKPEGLTASGYYNGYSSWAKDWTVPASLIGTTLCYSAFIDNTGTTDTRDAYLHIWTKDINGTYIRTNATSKTHLNPGESGRLVARIIPRDTEAFISCGLTMSAGCKASEPLLEIGSIGTDYEPYTGTTIPITFPSEAGTVYGGYVDLVNGKVIQTHKSIIFDGSESGWATYKTSDQIHFFRIIADKKVGVGTSISSIFPNVKNISFWDKKVYSQYGDHSSLNRIYINAPYEMPNGLSEWREWLSNNPMQLVYELAIPIEYEIDPQTLKSLRGTNNIWSNANGNIELSYWKH